MAEKNINQLKTISATTIPIGRVNPQKSDMILSSMMLRIRTVS